MARKGRPPNWKTPEQLDKEGMKYFDSTPESEWTITGLALALKTNRQTLCEYQEKDDFADTIKKLKTMVEHSYEKSLRKRGNAGDIFGLKNFGWSDRQSVDLTNNGKDLPTPILNYVSNHNGHKEGHGDEKAHPGGSGGNVGK